MRFTTSWDDGYKTDLRVADLLSKYNCTGTFYVCPAPQHEKQMLTEEDISTLARTHELGAHSLTHPHLTRIPEELAQEEITRSKEWIESIIKKPCTVFCYPYGDYNEHVKHHVQHSGFLGARTVTPLKFSGSDPFALPTSLQIYPFPWRKRWKRLSHYFNPLGHDLQYWKKLTAYRLPLTAYRSWISLAKALFIHALHTNQPWFHLWGHSFELEQYGMWNDFEKFLKFVNTFDDIEHVPNSALIPTI